MQKGENPKQCFINDVIDDYSTNTVMCGEVCTIETAKQYGIFGKNDYFNRLVPKTENIDVLQNNNEKGGFSLCHVNDSIAYQNCVLSTKNPWKTINSTRDYCMLPLNVTLPEALILNNSTKKIDKPMPIPKFKNIGDFCQEKWYDWFSIPDYHFGNKYQLVEISSNETKCVKPCDIGMMPYSTDGKSDKCIMRDKFEYGFYANTFHYLPISIILLLGSTKQTLLKKQESILSYVRTSNLENITTDFELSDNLMNDEETKTNIYNNIKADLRYYIGQLFRVPFNETNILPPSFSVQNISNRLMTRDRVIDAYEIAKNFYRLSTGTDTETLKLFGEWKKSLVDVCGFGINDTKFYKQLLILKKACNVAFDKTTSYSNDLIFNTLNKDVDDKSEKLYDKIEFKITKTDVVLSMRSDSLDGDADTSNIVKEQEELIRKEMDAAIVLQEKDNIKLNISKTDPNLYETDTLLKPRKKADEFESKTLVDKKKFIICIMLYIVVIVYILALVFLIALMFWTPVASFVNEIFIGFVYYIYIIADLFRGRYQPSTLTIKMLQLQKRFLEGKIFKDTSTYLI